MSSSQIVRHGHALTVIGWREWLGLPELGIRHVKAKIDTGARTSALHAYKVETTRERGVLMAAFAIHPKQGSKSRSVECMAEVIDRRWVSDSGGHRERRYVIATELAVGEVRWTVELTLTDRDTMRFRMLLGRTAMEGRLLVDPSASYLLGKPAKHHRP